MALRFRYGCSNLEGKFGQETRELGRLPKFPNVVIIAEDPLNYVPFVVTTEVRNGLEFQRGGPTHVRHTDAFNACSDRFWCY